MLNYIWFFMIALSLVCAAMTGRLPDLSAAVMEGASSAVTLSITLLGSMCAWLGFLQIAERGGLTQLMARAFSPMIDRLFPDYRDDAEVKGKICMNISANLLGLGNAATPLGLSAMQAMADRAKGEGLPTRGMVLFVVLNTASLQLLPVNMAAMRAAQGSAQPFGILPEIWLSSLGALAVAVTVCKLLERPGLDRGGAPMELMERVGAAALPLMIGLILLFGFVKGVDMFDAFIAGAKQGISTSLGILPTLIGLIIAVSMVRASGLLDLLCGLMEPVTRAAGIAPELLPLAILRPVSGSGASAYTLSILEQFGPDSPTGKIASVMAASTETTFYAVTVYYGAVGCRQLRQTLPAALAGDVAAVVLSVVTVGFFG